MDIQFDRDFVKKMNRAIRYLQLIAIIQFGVIYAMGLTKYLLDKQILVCALCVVAELFLMGAKNKLQKKEKELLDSKKNPTNS